MSRSVVSAAGRMVVVDEVLATRRMLCAVLSLLAEAGIDRGNMGVINVGEFPVHRGGDLLRRYGFGELASKVFLSLIVLR